MYLRKGQPIKGVGWERELVEDNFPGTPSKLEKLLYHKSYKSEDIFTRLTVI